MFTQKSETYGVTVPDYHSIVHGRPAPYLKANVVGDIAEIIRERQPKEIYVTHESDTTAIIGRRFGLSAMRFARPTSRGRFFAYVVHGAPPPSRRACA